MMSTPKTLPKPILKSNNKIHKLRPKFFTTNDSDIDDSNQKQEEEDQQNILYNDTTPFKSIIKSNDEKMIYNKNLNKPIDFTSAIYVLHNHKVSKDLVEIILASHDGFFKRLEEELNEIYYPETNNNKHLISNSRYKESFIAKLKEFLKGENCYLINSNVQINKLNNKLNTDIVNFMYKNNFILSEPTMPTISRSFGKIKDLTPKIQHVDDTLSCSLPIDSILLNCKNKHEKKTSLIPSQTEYSYFDAYDNEFEMNNDDLLYKIYRTKSIATTHSLTNHKRFNFYDRFNIKFQKNLSNSAFETNALIEASKKTKKFVRFADSLGLDLENVRIITNNSFADIFSIDYSSRPRHISSPLAALTVTEDYYIDPEIKSKTLALIPSFSLTPADDDCNCKLADYLFDNENKILKLLVRVKNISYEKHVFVRFTFNNWMSFNDIEAIYTQMKNLKTHEINFDYLFDYFIVTIFVPDCEQNKQQQQQLNIVDSNENFFYIEFAIYFNCCCNLTFWDNNFGNNYKFQCLDQILNII
jgi:hypothetical protein